MDPNTGRLYPDLDAARLDGVEHPVAISGRLEDIERISTTVRKAYDREQKRAKNKAAKKARRANR